MKKLFYYFKAVKIEFECLFEYWQDHIAEKHLVSFYSKEENFSIFWDILNENSLEQYNVDEFLERELPWHEHDDLLGFDND